MSKGVKDTEGKLRLNLVPIRATKEIAKVRAFGVAKYGEPWKWLHDEDTTADMFVEATMRHILEWRLGISNDPESGLEHLSHALTSLAMAVEIIESVREDSST